MSQPSQELHQLAQTLDDWPAVAPSVPRIYLFGSRVRGDHQRDSDVDVRMFVDKWQLDSNDVIWWTNENQTDFAGLKQRLPGPLAIHREKTDAADAAILEGAKNPVVVVGRVICIETPPKK